MKQRTVFPFAASLLVVALASCPLAQFKVTARADPESGPAPLTVDLWANVGVSHHPDTCDWDFGDGSPGLWGPWADYQSVVHVYDTPGSYKVSCLAVEEGAFRDLSDTDSVTVTVTAPSGGPLTVTIDGDPLSGCPNPPGPLGVSFTSTVSGGTPQYQYLWEFGDGSDSTEANPAHLYEFGPCDVTLTVTDAASDTVVSNTLTVQYCP